MRVVLWGSPLNPLSAIAANYFFEEKKLDLIIIPKTGKYIGHNGWRQLLSNFAIGSWRLLHVIARMARIKHSHRYHSLIEFLLKHREIPVLTLKFPITDVEARLKEYLNPGLFEETIFISCIFPFRIPASLAGYSRMVNIHPGLLPENRGSNPYFWCLALGHENSGLTYHVLTDRFDEGAILMRRVFPVPGKSSEHALERMTARCLKESLPEFWEKFDMLWENRTPQGEGKYFREPTTLDRRNYRLNCTLTASSRVEGSDHFA